MQWIDKINFMSIGMDIISVLFRICLAIVCGGMLGLERGKSNQSAGLRTHILVCLGATIIMLTGEYMFYEFNSGDPTRLGAQVVSGIGFLGAGSIIVEGDKRVRGLTTAAGLWASACIGLAIGIGFYLGGILGTVAVYIVISKFRSISDHFNHNDMWIKLYIEFETIEYLQEIYTTISAFHMQMGEVILNATKSNGYNAVIPIKKLDTITNEEIAECMKKIEGVVNLKFL